MQVQFLKLNEKAKLPAYQTQHAAGADIYACLDETFVLARGKIELISTGFAMEIPVGYEAQIRPRSGLSLKGITVANAPGTIDADYRGEVKIILINLSESDFEISHHDRIAQMVIAPVVTADFVEADELSGTERGVGGFGSTGVSQ